MIRLSYTRAFFLLIILSSTLIKAATIQGNVTNSVSKTPMEFVTVYLDDIGIFQQTGKDGKFLFDKIPVGTYYLIITQVGNEPYEKQIEIKDFSDEIIVNIELKETEIISYLPTYPIPKDSLIEEYHKKLNSLPQSKLLKLYIDSLFQTNYGMIVYSTFENLSELPIYIIQSVDCIKWVQVLRSNENVKNDTILTTYTDCLGMKTNPDSSDLIEIPPFSRKSYSPIFVNGRKENNDTISLSYNYQLKEKIKGNIFLHNLYPGFIYCYNMTYRGSIKSENSIILKKK